MDNKIKVGRLVVGPLATNCYICGDEVTRQGVVIDPGSDAQQILQAVQENGLTIRYILSTHGHFDHNGAVARLKKEFSCPFLIHPADIDFLREARRSAADWGFEIDEVPDPDEFIEDGQILQVGRSEFHVLHTPGHSPGGVSFLVAGEGILFSGDTLFFGSIGRTDFRHGSMSDLIRSIRKKLYVLPDETIVYSGHGDETTIGEEKKHNAYVRA